jgi:hypothetical protein
MAIIGLAGLAGGCAALQDAAGIPRAGHQQNGTYVVSSEEEKLACRQIKSRIDTLSSKLQILPVNAAFEEESEPKTVGAALGRIFGGAGSGLKATEEFQKAKAESDALNALLIKKQCV